MFFNRLGRFFFLVGGLSGILFILSDRAMDTDFGFLFGAGIFLLAGLFLLKSNPLPQSPPSERFSFLRRNKIKRDEDILKK